MNDHEITALVTRLARPHPSGGIVIERAAILAAGADYPAIIDWITAHSGTPETTPPGRSRGLHGSRITDGNTPRSPATDALRAARQHGLLTPPSPNAPCPKHHRHRPAHK